MEEILKSIIGGIVMQSAKVQAELLSANAKIVALTKELADLKAKAEPK